MRSKLNTTLALAAFGLFTVATACGDDNGTSSPGGGEAGESGSGSGGDGATSNGGSTSGNGGSTSGGSTSGNGGSTSGTGGSTSGTGGSISGTAGDPAVNGGNGGDPAVNGGSSSGNGGDPSVNGGEAGDGGEQSGSGGAAAGAGGGGPVICTPITLGAFGLGDLEPAYTEYGASFTPNIGAADDDVFVLSLQAPPVYDGDATGTFDLTENGDDNYKTCARCILVFADSGQNRTVYYASEGTLVIDPASTQLTGNIDATVTNLKLVEVTIANDYTSTPVSNGRCLTVASADIVVMEGGPVGWTCNPDYYADGDCDCGCGVKDIDCTGTTDAGECEYCTECSNDTDPCGAGEVDPADTTMCL